MSRLEAAIRRRIEIRRSRLAKAAGKVESLSPLSTLRRGYAIPIGPLNRVLRTVSEFTVGGRFDLRVADGRVQCEAIEGTEEGPP